MCTVVVYRRPGHPWPLILGANRDEMGDRPWLAPARHWPDRPEVRAGLDELAGGSWFGINNQGVTAGILNRMGTLGPLAGKRSRGELVLEALDHADAAQAAEALADLDGAAYRPFNLLVADDQDAFWLANRPESAQIAVTPLPVGFSMLTAHDMNDRSSPRIGKFLPLFERAETPDPENNNWKSWIALLSTRSENPPGEGEDVAMNIRRSSGFGTVSSTLLALPDSAKPPGPIRWLFASGRPDEAPFLPVAP